MIKKNKEQWPSPKCWKIKSIVRNHHPPDRVENHPNSKNFLSDPWKYKIMNKNILRFCSGLRLSTKIDKWLNLIFVWESKKKSSKVSYKNSNISVWIFDLGRFYGSFKTFWKFVSQNSPKLPVSEDWYGTNPKSRQHIVLFKICESCHSEPTKLRL